MNTIPLLRVVDLKRVVVLQFNSIGKRARALLVPYSTALLHSRAPQQEGLEKGTHTRVAACMSFRRSASLTRLPHTPLLRPSAPQVGYALIHRRNRRNRRKEDVPLSSVGEVARRVTAIMPLVKRSRTVEFEGVSSTARTMEKRTLMSR